MIFLIRFGRVRQGEILKVVYISVSWLHPINTCGVNPRISIVTNAIEVLWQDDEKTIKVMWIGMNSEKFNVDEQQTGNSGVWASFIGEFNLNAWCSVL